jgi:hypothetical protein
MSRPAGRWAQVTDRALTHRVAEGSVRDFVRRTACMVISRAESVKSRAESTP